VTVRRSDLWGYLRDWAHWHGFFQLQQSLYRLEKIYERRLATGMIE